MFEALAKAFNANPNVAYPLVDCALINTKGTVDFKFGNTVINVPYADFIWRPQPGTCQLGVFRSDGKCLLLQSGIKERKLTRIVRLPRPRRYIPSSRLRRLRLGQP